MPKGALEPNKTFSVDFLVQVGLNQYSLLSPLLGEGKLIFCCTGSWENYFGLVSQQNNNYPKFQGCLSKNKKY